MLNAGVDVMHGYWFSVSCTHGKKDIDETVAAFEEALAQMKREGAV